MPYVGQKPADIISTAVDTVTGKFSGEVDAASLDISGNIDVDGTTNLDVTDIDGAVDMASTLQVDGAITSSAGATITTADNTDTLSLISTDADASSGPNLRMYRNSGSPADADILGVIEYEGRNDNSQDVRYVQITSQANDVSDGSEDGSYYISTMVGGALSNRMNVTPAETVFNEESKDIDFRVESNGQTHMLFVDGARDAVGIGSNTPDSGRLLHIEEGGTACGVTFKDTAGTQFGITSDSNKLIVRSDSDSVNIFRVSPVNCSIFSTEATARLNIESNLSSYTTVQLKNNNSNNSGVFLQCVDDGGGGIGGITQASNTAIAFNTSSDYRLKENVSYTFDATTRVKQLKPCRFNFIKDKTNTAIDGFLAHEVSDIVPTAITGDKDGTEDIGTVKDADGNIVDSDATELQFTERKKDEVYTSDYTWTKTTTRIVHQQIDHSKLIPLLTKALQEQQATIEALTARIVTLENA